MFEIDVFCALPDVLASPLRSGVIGRGVEAGLLDVRSHDLHQLSPESHGKIDEAAFGGGPGMVLRVDVVAHALEEIFDAPADRVKEDRRVLLMTPQGRLFDQVKARDYADGERLVILCGRYEGVDERIREHLVSDEISIGDYVISGGELAALVVIESVVRLLPGVLGNVESLSEESFHGDLLEYPQYTRPSDFRGWRVPEVLLGGNHAEINKWRKRMALERTFRRRPDLIKGADLTEEEREFLGGLD